VRYRRFSIAHALVQERAPLPAPLQQYGGGGWDGDICGSDADAAIVGNPLQLRAASRLLEGRPLKLLPDQE
jgi:hypothetical protein